MSLAVTGLSHLVLVDRALFEKSILFFMDQSNVKYNLSFAHHLSTLFSLIL